MIGLKFKLVSVASRAIVSSEAEGVAERGVCDISSSCSFGKMVGMGVSMES